MNNLRGKKLLILGGVQLACSVIKLAQQNGIYTVVDYNEDSPAKRIADKSYLVSTTDVDGIVELCKEEGIDGVFTSYIESMLPYCCIICERLKLPFYATLEQIKITSNKKSFKELCRKNEVPVIEDFNINIDDELFNVDYPVFTKPVDNSGARGMTICKNAEELKIGYQKALEFSKSKEILVEKYMDESSECVNIDYLIIDGEFYLVGVGDKSVYRTVNCTTPITSSVIRNGYIFIEAFHDKNGFHFYEMGFRIGGGQYYVMNSQMTHVNFMEMLIRYSLTGHMLPEDKFSLKLSPDLSSKCCGLVILLSVGEIASIDGLDEILALKDVVDFTQMLFVGDVLQQSDVGTLRQAFARVYIVSKSNESLKDAISKIYTLLRINNPLGENLIIKNC